VSPPGRHSGGHADGADGPRVLPPDLFTFELDAELRRAVRTRNYLTLVVVEAGRDREAPAAVVDAADLQTIVEAFSSVVRDTDLIGYLEHAALGLVLLDADIERTTQVIDRAIARLDTSKVDGAVHIAVGAASYPADGVDAGSLERAALRQPIARCRGRRAAEV
jgi:hypothetical protein